MTYLKPCPFCGGSAGIRWTDEPRGIQSIGCIAPSMACPNPSIVAYKVDGEFDYTFWNRRVTNETN